MRSFRKKVLRYQLGSTNCWFPSLLAPPPHQFPPKFLRCKSSKIQNKDGGQRARQNRLFERVQQREGRGCSSSYAGQEHGAIERPRERSKACYSLTQPLTQIGQQPPGIGGQCIRQPLYSPHHGFYTVQKGWANETKIIFYQLFIKVFFLNLNFLEYTHKVVNITIQFNFSSNTVNLKICYTYKQAFCVKN